MYMQIKNSSFQILGALRENAFVSHDERTAKQ